VIRLCAEHGSLEVLADLSGRTPAQRSEDMHGLGRELFAMFRHFADSAEMGGSAMLAEAGL
jgi:phosphogluconate dehydratase